MDRETLINERAKWYCGFKNKSRCPKLCQDVNAPQCKENVALAIQDVKWFARQGLGFKDELSFPEMYCTEDTQGISITNHKVPRELKSEIKAMNKFRWIPIDENKNAEAK